MVKSTELQLPGCLESQVIRWLHIVVALSVFRHCHPGCPCHPGRGPCRPGHPCRPCRPCRPGHPCRPCRPCHHHRCRHHHHRCLGFGSCKKMCDTV